MTFGSGDPATLDFNLWFFCFVLRASKTIQQSLITSLSAIMSMISSHITLKIQRYLRACYSDSSVSVLVFKHMMSGHYTVYLSSANDSWYQNHSILHQALETLLKISNIFVLSLEVVLPRSAKCHVPKTAPSHSPLQNNHLDDLILDDPGVVDQSESNDWPVDQMDIWKSWNWMYC